MPDLIQFIQNRKELYPFFPAFEDIPKCGREWVANILETKCTRDFQSFVKDMEQQRRQKIDQAKNLQVRIYKLIYRFQLHLTLLERFVRQCKYQQRKAKLTIMLRLVLRKSDLKKSLRKCRVLNKNLKKINKLFSLRL